MVLTKAELIGSLQNEARILVHLAGKVDPAHLDYRPTPKQRSTLELFRYLSMMGPVMVRAAKGGGFDPAAWSEAEKAAAGRSFAETVATIGTLGDLYAKLLGEWSDGDFRIDLEMFGNKSSRGAFLVNTVLSGYAAYRTQIFLYLKACGRTELNTMNLWAGMDGPLGA
ncbi:MAG: hypothetical protein ABL963_08270 [Longimicrobiales bacterium]